MYFIITYFNIAALLLCGAIWLSIAAFLRLTKKKSFAYLVFFSIFYIYVVKVLDYTLFQFQALILLKHFMPELMLNGLAAGKDINLIPLITLRLEDLKTSLLNILLFLPFGFGLPFITDFRLKKVVVAGALASLGIELLQLVMGFMGPTVFRVADVNDVIFNTIGAAIGYLLFAGFTRLYRRLKHSPTV